MAIKANAEKIEDLALLKLGTAPNGRQRRQVSTVCAIHCAHANDYRTMFVGYRVKMINRLKITRDFFLSRLGNLFLLTINEFLHLNCFLHDAIRPIDTGHVGTKVET